MDTRKETMFNKVPEYANIVEVIEINSWVSEYAQNMTNNFGEELRKLRKLAGESQVSLSAKTLITPDTIGRLEGRITVQPQLETVIAICIGLRLNPAISKQLIKIAGYSLSASCESYGIYSLIIDRYYYKGIMWCNDFLIEAGYAPLTRRCEKDSSSECKMRSLFHYRANCFLNFSSRDFFNLYTFQFETPIVFAISSVDILNINMQRITCSSFGERKRCRSLKRSEE